MEVLVETAKETYGALQEGIKYYLVIPGILGGEYSVTNIKIAPQIEIIRYSGYIGKQIKDLPDGAKIELEVID